MPRRIVAFVLWFEPLNAFRCHFATISLNLFRSLFICSNPSKYFRMPLHPFSWI